MLYVCVILVRLEPVMISRRKKVVLATQLAQGPWVS